MANSVSPIPRVIWMYWHEGERRAPQLVSLCIRSWRLLNPEWDVVVVDESNLHEFVQPETLVPRWKELPKAKQANLIRLMILEAYGGLWADATLYCSTPIDKWINQFPKRSLALVDVPSSDDKIFDNFFIGARPHHPFIHRWLVGYAGYIKEIPSQMTSSSTKRILRRYPFLRLKLLKPLMVSALFRDRIGAPYFAAQYVGTSLLLRSVPALIEWSSRISVTAGKVSSLLKQDRPEVLFREHLETENLPFWKFSSRVPPEFEDQQRALLAEADRVLTAY